MAKTVELKERGTNNTLYPVTSIKNVTDFPLTDTPNLVLNSTENSGMEWKDIGLSKIISDKDSYGVSWKPNAADPTLTRVGNLTYHKTLPIQSEMKGCIYNPKEKRVVYWLDEDNWKYKKGGNPNKGETEQLARLDGYDGEVMVYVPEFWIRSWDEPDRREVRVSPTYVDATWEHQPAVFIGAYRDTVLNEVPESMGYLSTLEVKTAVCVANPEPYCVGGDDNQRSKCLGRPKTHTERPDMRSAERKAGKEILSYRQYKNILYWLWVIEYATFNSQAPFNSNLTPEGYHQGGMGMSTIDWNEWGTYNLNNPLCPNGYLNEYGNNTISVDLEISSLIHLQVAKWRGIENLLGEVITNVDGVVIESGTIDYTFSYNRVYTTDDPTKYGDTIDGMILSGLETQDNNNTGYIKEFDLGTTAEIIPRLNGGDATQYKCDYHMLGSVEGMLFTILFGGHVTRGSNAGLGAFSSQYGVRDQNNQIGFRAACLA